MDGPPGESVVSHHRWLDPLLVGYGDVGPPLALIACLIGSVSLGVGMAKGRVSIAVPVSFGVGALSPLLGVAVRGSLEVSPLSWLAIAALAAAAAFSALQQASGRGRVSA